MDEMSLKELLLKKHEEFKNVYEQHKRCDGELEKLLKKNYPTEREQVSIRELKKKKLVLKDRLYHIMSDYKTLHHPNG